MIETFKIDFASRNKSWYRLKDVDGKIHILDCKEQRCFQPDSDVPVSYSKLVWDNDFVTVHC